VIAAGAEQFEFSIRPALFFMFNVNRRAVLRTTPGADFFKPRETAWRPAEKSRPHSCIRDAAS
jgi:hypothetical protein